MWFRYVLLNLLGGSHISASACCEQATPAQGSMQDLPNAMQHQRATITCAKPTEATQNFPSHLTCSPSCLRRHTQVQSPRSQRQQVRPCSCFACLEIHHHKYNIHWSLFEQLKTNIENRAVTHMWPVGLPCCTGDMTHLGQIIPKILTQPHCFESNSLSTLLQSV